MTAYRASRQGIQPVQWLHQWQGAADGLQHSDGDPASAAISSATPL